MGTEKKVAVKKEQLQFFNFQKTSFCDLDGRVSLRGQA